MTYRSATLSGDWSVEPKVLCHADERAVSGDVRTASTGDAVPFIAFNTPVMAGLGDVNDGDVLGLGGGYWAGVRNYGSGGTVTATLHVLCAKS